MRDSLDQSQVQQLETEIEALSNLKSDNIVNILRHGLEIYMKNSGKKKEVLVIILEMS